MYENDSSNYYIKLPEFEGPFDLLLFFVQRDELDIYNIPIAKITEDFLDYLHTMEALNINLASEFIVVAANLIQIKTKSLIPILRNQENEDGDDPRNQLVQKLIEYKQFKNISDELAKMEEKRSQQFSRGNLANEIKEITSKALIESEWETLDLYNLFKTFRRVMDEFEKEEKFQHKIHDFNYTIDNQKLFIFDLLSIENQKKLSFELIFSQMENKMHAIITFLAILEMINSQEIRIQTGSQKNQLWLEPAA